MNLEIITEKAVSDVRPAPILFVHGMWHAAWCWAEHLMPYFAQHGYVSYALSLRGHSGSQGRERLRWTSLADYVSDVTRAMSQMERVPVLVGHSMGGMIVQKYLESNGAPGAVLLASAPPKGVIPATVRVAFRHPLAFMKANLTMSMFPLVSTPRLAQEAFFSADMPEEKVRSYFSRLQDESYRAYLDMMGLSLPRPKRVKTPLLVLGGQTTVSFCQGTLRRRRERTARGQRFFPNMAHDMMLEDGWQTVADRILGWLNEQGL